MIQITAASTAMAAAIRRRSECTGRITIGGRRGRRCSLADQLAHGCPERAGDADHIVEMTAVGAVPPAAAIVVLQSFARTISPLPCTDQSSARQPEHP
jgi:hypothetical protein